MTIFEIIVSAFIAGCAFAAFIAPLAVLVVVVVRLTEGTGTK